MRESKLFSVARVLSYRALQAFVFGPAIVVALVAAAAAAQSASPIESGLTLMYRWAETSVKPVSAGQVLLRECRPIGDCLPVRAVAAERWISTTARSIRSIYLAIAAVTLIGIVLHLGWRRFVGWTRDLATDGLSPPDGEDVRLQNECDGAN